MEKRERYIIGLLLVANFILLGIIVQYKLQRTKLSNTPLVSYGDDVSQSIRSGPLGQFLSAQPRQVKWLLLVFLSGQLKADAQVLQDIAHVFHRFSSQGLAVLVCIGPGKQHKINKDALRHLQLAHLDDSKASIANQFGFSYHGQAMLLININSGIVEFSGHYLVRGFTLSEMIGQRL